MKCTIRIASLAASVLLLATSCAEQQTESFEKFENMALKAWVAKYRPEIANNYQEEGGYYVDVIDPGDTQAPPVNDTICWVSFDFSGRDLSGNVILTRRASEARLVGSYSRYTHYVPFYRYCGEVNAGLMEGTHLAMRNKLHLDPAYAAERGLDAEFCLRKGSEVVLYLPSRVVGSVSGTGGYEGQYSLDSRKPFIVSLVIEETVKNPLEHEGEALDAFCKLPANGGLRIYNKDEKDPTTSPLPTDLKDRNHPYNIAERWVSVNDTIPQVYVNLKYDPTKERITYPNPYKSAYEPYNAFEAMEQKIQKALRERFHPDEESAYKGVMAMSDSVKLDGKANIWYIARLIDGFIVDTNIDEVREIIYGSEAKLDGKVYEYTPESNGAISAWYYAVPNLRFGQWAAIATTSTNAYGSTGRAGGTSTSTSSTGGYSNGYLDYLNMMSYYNGYYGSTGYYNPYYNGYYGMGGYYGGGYYDPYYGMGSGMDTGGETVTTTSIESEILPFASMIFELYIEPKE